jgi:Bacterial PH domain
MPSKKIILPQTFSASLDGVSKVLTSIMAPIFLLWPAYMMWALRNETDKSYQVWFIGVSVVLFIVFLGCFYFWPKQYEVTESEIIIHRQFSKVSIAKNEVATAEAVPKKEMGIVIRALGNGGIFGYTGNFTSKQYGRMKWYVTNQQNIVLLTLKDGKQICISPDDIAGFIATLDC